jgi:hypothetical protein
MLYNADNIALRSLPFFSHFVLRTGNWYRFHQCPARNTKWLKNGKLRRAILSAFYNISQRNFGILLILWCSFKPWWNFCLDLLRSKFCSLGNIGPLKQTANDLHRPRSRTLLSDPFVKLSDVERKPLDILSDPSKNELVSDLTVTLFNVNVL